MPEQQKKIFGFDVDQCWDYENGFYLTSQITRLAKVLTHYELYKLIMRIPGHIVECGVYKGASLIRFATFREICEASFARKIIGFDAFGQFPKQEDKADNEFVKIFDEAGGEGIPREELEKVFALKKIDNVELVQGDILETIPEYISENPEMKIALLHIDVDVYAPTKVILDNLYDKVVRGGIIVFDDYSLVAGETRAVEEYFSDYDVIIERLPNSYRSTFIRKK